MLELFPLFHHYYLCLYLFSWLNYVFPALAAIMQQKNTICVLYEKFTTMLNNINIFMSVLHFFLVLWFSLGTAHADIIWEDSFITCWIFTVLHLLQRQGFRAGSVNPVNHQIYTPVISHHGNGGF